jgi:UDP-N-acetylglucosamine transferase subunit ALG13
VIFLTVGFQLPFDRLVHAVDLWAGAQKRTDVFAQIGHSDYKPKHLKYHTHVLPAEFRDLVRRADLVVSHAGMGSIITALELAKPIIVMPRRAALREHRNDHQLAAARLARAYGAINFVNDESELISELDHIVKADSPCPVSPHASPELIGRISAFITECAKPQA